MKAVANRRKVVAILLFLFTGCFPQFTLGAENYKAGDKLYVAPTTGINVRQSPDIKAPILINLPFNTVVTIVSDSLPAQSFQVAVTNFNTGKLTLQGHWVKVKTEKTIGYVFDGLLSQFIGLKLGSLKEESYYVALFGKPSLRILKKNTMLQGRKVSYETEIKSYPRGVVMESTFLDDCYSEVYTFSSSFNETYWLVQRMMLEADAVQDVKLKKVNTKTVLSFDSCT